MTVIEASPSLTQTVGRLRFDPVGYVMYAFPWGRPGTALADESGPKPKAWCKVGCLPDDRDLRADLTNVEYGYDASHAILLERKRDMRRRGLASPDDGDVLALTFAYSGGGGTTIRSRASSRSWPA